MTIQDQGKSPRAAALIDDWQAFVLSAHQRIGSFIAKTPLEAVHGMGSQAPAQLYFKREDLQHTGSFKLRGATNKLLSLSNREAGAGVIAASNGNHGLGVAAAARRAGIAAEVYVSSHVSPGKVRKIEELGARIHRAGSAPLEAELAARAAAAQSGKVFISPYNDVDVIAGQGTIAVELESEVRRLDAVFVSVGGGGLIGGIGAYLKKASPETEIVGCWPENSRVLYESLRAGRIVNIPEQPTLSESTAGGLESDSVTLGICQRVIDASVLVTEEEILSALRRVRDTQGWLMEGAAAVALAGFLKEAARFAGKSVAVVICGGNVSGEVLERIG
jgi:threonine dehydratase